MIEQDFHIARLIAAYVAGELTAEETAELEAWRTASASHEALFQQLIRPGQLHAQPQQPAGRRDQAWQQINRRIHRHRQLHTVRQLLAYAALLLLPLLCIGILRHQQAAVPRQPPAATALAHIRPGTSQAILTLDNGTRLHLGDTLREGVRQIDNTHIRVDSATLNYHSTAGMNRKPLYNQVETPHGSEYSLILSDGTKVYLNAQSRLRFPTAFQGDSREVELTGEGYFEVSRSTRPFIVRTRGMQVEVLGTTFNLSAYPHEDLAATLVSGSVRVATGQGQSCLLQPSQQAVITPGSNTIQVRHVDTSFYTSWTRGKIYFKDQRLEDILHTLSRWYDIHVHYADQRIRDLRFGCHLNRYEEITPFIHLLEKTGKLKATIQGTSITLYLTH